ncbi:CRISPR-associated endonuclease Cas2 [Truepera radiovictrix]|uniref:CRISPR-associated endoribonuclease Cas2 n=1 Tax=Truepera radiovictrix (strain DSM 17093 / CIP 108686 / LMG 22925 / RQ-24) TaxID=649638 RepID=D7CS33_TRURR|nr:CRISPR-associated endonuclease Cas2 [Truepera radiovictrix]ADI13565.1 CRISPR-associated protein Cas2 [Truepera radiovictrix DSM 17093]WMT57872.1 CRISPR-associated endonuclease Cas2 [Truepera radiovictrix]
MAGLYTVSYDIPNDNRRVKLANVLKSFGERVQYSVFECWLEPRELRELRQKLEARLNEREDSVRIYPVGSPVEVLGSGSPTEDARLFMF